MTCEYACSVCVCVCGCVCVCVCVSVNCLTHLVLGRHCPGSRIEHKHMDY